MLRENWRSIARVERLADGAIVAIAFFAAYFVRSNMNFFESLTGVSLPFTLTGERLGAVRDYYVVIFVGIVTYLTALKWFGGYGSMRLSTFGRLTRIAFLSSCVVFVALATVIFLLKLDLSRSVITLFCGFSAVLLVAERYLVLRALRYWRRKGRNFRTIVVCGIGVQAENFIETVWAHPELGIGIKGVADLSDGNLFARKRFLKFLDSFKGNVLTSIIFGADSVQKLLTETAVDEVVFTDVIPVMKEVEKLAGVCAEQGIRTTLVADLFSMGIATSHVSYLGKIPLVHYQMPPGDRWELSVKRFIDVIFAALALIILAPLFVVIAMAIYFDSGRPIFFKHKRVGLNGRLFSLYKFRSMVINAEELKSELINQNEMDGPAFKVHNDPRITRVGSLLRRYSLDELPQFWNVLRGDMSLVGPRPPVPGEVCLYERKDRRRLSMRPGLTCTWQVSGRNNIRNFDSWVSLDLDYIDNWSLRKDLFLMVRTIPAVLFGNGAR